MIPVRFKLQRTKPILAIPVEASVSHVFSGLLGSVLSSGLQKRLLRLPAFQYRHLPRATRDRRVVLTLGFGASRSNAGPVSAVHYQ